MWLKTSWKCKSSCNWQVLDLAWLGLVTPIQIYDSCFALSRNGGTHLLRYIIRIQLTKTNPATLDLLQRRRRPPYPNLSTDQESTSSTSEPPNTTTTKVIIPTSHQECIKKDRYRTARNSKPQLTPSQLLQKGELARSIDFPTPTIQYQRMPGWWDHGTST